MIPGSVHEESLNIRPLYMNGQACNFDPILKNMKENLKKIKKMEILHKESSYVTWLPGKIPNLEYGTFEKKSVQKNGYNV